MLIMLLSATEKVSEQSPNCMLPFFLGVIVGAMGFYFLNKNKTAIMNKLKNCNRHPSPATQENASVEKPYSPESDLASEIKHFSGFMNSLCSIPQKSLSLSNATFTNLGQTIKAHGTTELKQWYSSFVTGRENWDHSKYSEKAKQMFTILKSCGVVCSSEKEIIWDDFSSDNYQVFEEITNGQRCEVVFPCWYYDDKIFEKGLVKPIKSN